MGYATIKQVAIETLIEQRSKFIATATPVENSEQAEAFINRMKAESKDASHHVFAYLIDSGHMRASDDGEPTGTAGVPILTLLKNAGLTKICVVVTRYFGGILLGAGGLIRAYTAAAKQAIEAAGIIEMVLCDCMELTVNYSDSGCLQNAISLSDAEITNISYGENVSISLYARQESCAMLIEELINLTSGRICITKSESKYLPAKKP